MLFNPYSTNNMHRPSTINADPEQSPFGYSLSSVLLMCIVAITIVFELGRYVLLMFDIHM